MSTLAVTKTALDSMTAKQRKLVRWVVSRLEFGQPALYQDGATQRYVFDDPRIDLRQLAVLGCLAANWADVPGTYDPDGKTRAEIEADIRAWLAPKVKWPEAIDYTNVANPWQHTLTQNGAPAALRAAGEVPATWTPVTT